MLFIQRRHQLVEDDAVRGIQIHADLLIDDALLLFHALLRKVRRGDEFQQQIQILPKMVGAAEIVGGHVVAGEGVHHGAQGGKLGGHIPPPGKLEHFMLQIVGNAGGDGILFAVQPEMGMDGAKVRHEIGNAAGKALSRDHRHGQAAGQRLAVEGFVQFGVGK